jgi:hypothetical protein
MHWVRAYDGISPSPLTGEGWGEGEDRPHLRHFILSERS